MGKSVPIQIFGAIAGKGGLIAFASRLLLGWYLHEIRGVTMPEHPGEAIVTYPLA
jgi:hypothetical protein